MYDGISVLYRHTRGGLLIGPLFIVAMNSALDPTDPDKPSARISAKDAAGKSAKTSCEQLRQDALLCHAKRNVHGQGGRVADFEADCADLFMAYKTCMKDWQAEQRELARKASGSTWGMK